MSYFVKIRGQIRGPFSDVNVKEMIKQGTVGKSSSVSADRINWKKAEEFEEFFPKGISSAILGVTEQVKSGGFDMADPVWYVSQDGQVKTGPHSGVTVIEMIQNFIILPTTFVWRNGEQPQYVSRISYFQTALALQKSASEMNNRAAASIHPPLTRPRPEIPRPLQKTNLTDRDAKKINAGYFWYFGFLTASITAFLLSFFFSTLCEGLCVTGDLPNQALITAGYISSVIFYITYGLAYLLVPPLIYRMWSVLPQNEASTTPMKAALFLFIPIFNLAWQFMAFCGLAKSLNNALDARRSFKRASVGLNVVYSVLNIVTLGIGNVIFGPLAIGSLKKTAIEFIKVSR